MKSIKFSFEDLEVWQKAIEFAKSVINVSEVLSTKNRHFRLIEQLEAAAASIAMNIAEGKGRYSKKEYMQFLYIARGSLFEVVTLLTIFSSNKWINDKQLEDFKKSSEELSKMLSGLITSIRNSFPNTQVLRPNT